MIDALFGSKTRVKLLHLFLNNPGKSFYVREITRKIDEQINSVRRELSNMLEVGIITSDSSDNKLYYQINQRYEHFVSLRTIFQDGHVDAMNISAPLESASSEDYRSMISTISGLRMVVFSGVLVRDSTAPVDIILVGNVSPIKIKALISHIEKSEGREINYSLLSCDEFYYRYSIHDRFISEILNGKHSVIIDKDNVLTK